MNPSANYENSTFAAKIFSFYVGPNRQLFQVHGSIFEYQSQPLNRMINGEFCEARLAEAWLQDVEPAVFSAVCEFAYSTYYAGTLQDAVNKAEAFPTLFAISVATDVAEHVLPESCAHEEGADGKSETKTRGMENNVVPTICTMDIPLEYECWQIALFHIKVFYFADQYLFSHLKQHAYSQIEASLAEINDDADCEVFCEYINLLQHVLAMQTLGNSVPCYNVKQLIIDSAASQFSNLVKIPSFEDWMRRQPDVLYEIACKGTR